MSDLSTLPHNPQTIPRLKDMSRLRELQHSPLDFLSHLTQEYGDIVQIKLFFWPVVIINHPDYIKHVLQDNHRNYNKNVPIFNVFRPLLGNGLVTNYGGDSWLQQRRLMQPAFHHQRIAALGSQITGATEVMLQRWEQYAVKQQPFDVAEEMLHLALNIVSNALFHSDINDQTNAFGEAFMQVNTFLIEYFNHPFPPLSVPTPRNRRFHRALAALDAVVYDIIAQRRQRGGEHEDLLAMLMQAVDADTGQHMSDQQLRDEIMTLLVAGHETAANALAWCWYLLGKNEENEKRLHSELEQVLAGRQPTAADLPQLPYTRMLFEEAMRLYPPVWIIMRKTILADKIGGYDIPANAYILWSTYAMHRHPNFWEQPEKFDPERFTPERIATRPRHAYIPFSHGPRICIGNSFAMTESQLILATIAQRYRLKPIADQKIEPEPLMTLRPRYGIKVQLEAR